MQKIYFGVVIALVTAVIVGAGLLASVPPAKHVSKPAHSGLRITRSQYYRFKLDLTYKKAPVHIEFVGGCGVHSSFSVASGGSTVETLAMSAFVFAARMPEGHAIVVRTIPSIEAFRVCDGATTASGAVPRNWLPTIAWYEHDDDFSFGIAYVTQDAYESPRARFGFVAATVELATRADYEAYLRDGPKNLLPEYLSDALSHHDSPDLPKPIPPEILQNPRKAWPFASRPLCRYARVFQLDEAQQAQARRIRPSDGSRYWHETPRAADSIRLTHNQHANEFELFSPAGSPERPDRHRLVYPIKITEGLAEVDAKTSDHEFFDHELLLGDPTLAGFAYCDSLASDSGDLVNALAGKPVRRRLPIRCRIGETTLSRDFHCHNDTVQPIHDGDRFGIMVEYILL